MNLLPTAEKEVLRKGLKSRFIIILMILVSTSFLVGIVMLFPSYFLIRGQSSLAMSANASAETENEEALKEILNFPKEIETKLKFFQANLPGDGIINSLSEIITHLPERVKLNSIVFTRNQNYKGKKGTTVLISGVASDRESLVSFGTLLKESGSFYLVDVPVSSLTKDKNLPFSMNIFIEEQK